MNSDLQAGEKGKIAPDLLAILCCPETKQGLSVLSQENLQIVNDHIQKGQLKNKGGEIIKDPLDGGLLREDQQVLYAIRDQIPIMLIEEGIMINPLDLQLTKS